MDSTKENFDCAICLQLMAEPVTLAKCKHSFCLHCLSNLEESSPDTCKCPMCRTEYNCKFDISINLELQKTIEQANPEQFSQRLTAVIKEKEEFITNAKIKIIYGNSHQLLHGPQNTNNNHQWTLYVKVELKGPALHLIQDVEDLIENVEYTLHPTFDPHIVLVNNYPFCLTRIGWGVFNIPIKVVFKNKYNLPDLKLDHQLSFNGEGLAHAQTIRLSDNK